MENCSILLKYNIGMQIKAYADKKNNYSKIYQMINSESFISDDFIKNNLEGILVCYGICHCQNYDFYIRFFNYLINKYDMTLDYLEYKETGYEALYEKWSIFSQMIVDLLTCSGDENKNKLFNSDIIRNYLSTFHDFYSYMDHFRNLKWETLGSLLEIPCYQEEIVGLTQRELNHIIIDDMLASTKLPDNILHNPLFIKKIAHNIDFEEYIAAIQDLEYHNYVAVIDKQHDLFCDNLINSFNSKTKCFPILKEKDFPNKLIYHPVLKQIYKSLNKSGQSTSIVHQQLSKYIVIGFIFSRFFKTSWYNLSIDMKTLIEYIDDPLRKKIFDFNNRDIYYKLVNFKDIDTIELVELYKCFKNKNIMHEFYDDWHKAQLEFVNELNSNALNNDNLGFMNETLTSMHNISVYELRGQDYYMITRNTSVNVRNDNIKEKLKETKYARSYLSLSIQDQNHYEYCTHEDCGRDTKYQLKLVYGSLDENYIGMMYPTDAYTNGLSSVEIESDSSRKIYPLRRLMQNTSCFNDISYIKTDTLKPIAVLCESEIIPEQLKAAQALKLPIILRYNHLYNKSESTFQNETSYVKHYKLFEYRNL